MLCVASSAMVAHLLIFNIGVFKLDIFPALIRFYLRHLRTTDLLQVKLSYYSVRLP